MQQALLLAGQEPAQGLLVLPGGKQLIFNLFAPAGGDQDKDMVGRGLQLLGQFINGRQFGAVGGDDGGVDLERQARVPQDLNALQGGFKSTGYLSQSIVAACCGPINGDAQALDAGILELPGDSRRQQGAVHRHDHAMAQTGAISGQFEDIVPEQGFAAGQDDHHLTQIGDVFQQGFAFSGSQFAFIWPHTGRGPAVGAVQVAAAGGLPGQEAEGRDFGFRFRHGMLIHF